MSNTLEIPFTSFLTCPPGTKRAVNLAVLGNEDVNVLDEEAGRYVRASWVSDEQEELLNRLHFLTSCSHEVKLKAIVDTEQETVRFEIVPWEGA